MSSLPSTFNLSIPNNTQSNHSSSSDQIMFDTLSNSPQQHNQTKSEDSYPEQGESACSSDPENDSSVKHLPISDQSKIIRAKRNREAAYRSRTRNKIRQSLLEEEVEKQLKLNIELKSLLQYLLTNLPKETLKRARASMAMSGDIPPFPTDLQPLTNTSIIEKIDDQKDDDHEQKQDDITSSSSQL